MKKRQRKLQNYKYRGLQEYWK